MRRELSFLAAVLLVATAVTITMAMPARADDRTTVEAFYTQILSDTAAPGLGERVAKVLSPEWESIGDYSGKAKTRDQFTGQMQGFGKLIPDMAFEIQEVIEAGDRYVVRSRATGTPLGPLFGIPAGNSFDILAIDIHTVKDGMIIRSYHVEDWAGAMRQLKGK